MGVSLYNKRHLNNDFVSKFNISVLFEKTLYLWNTVKLQQFYCYMYFLGNANPHDAPHHTFFSINVDKAFVDTHFPSIPSRCALSTRRF